MRFFTSTFFLVSLLATARAQTPEYLDLPIVDYNANDVAVLNDTDIESMVVHIQRAYAPAVQEIVKRNYGTVVPVPTGGYQQQQQPQAGQHQYGGALDGADAVGSGHCDMALWSAIRDDIIHNVFGGTCGDQARRATRLSFHDAGTYDRRTRTGGPNGSILKFLSEAGQPENGGLMPIVLAMREVHDRWAVRAPGRVSYADLAQLAGMLGTVICPGGPSVKFDVGRLDSDTPDMSTNLPGVDQSVNDFIAIFGRMGLSVTDLVALIGAHSTGRRHDGPTPNLPFDTTITIWDTKFYTETLRPQVPAGTQRMPSDDKMARDPRTRPLFVKFQDDHEWDNAFEKSMRRMANLGHHGLVNCPIIPPEINLQEAGNNRGNNRRQRRDVGDEL
jgi:hypothetical protein